MTPRFHIIPTTLAALSFHLEAVGDNERVVSILPDMTKPPGLGCVQIVVERTDRAEAAQTASPTLHVTNSMVEAFYAATEITREGAIRGIGDGLRAAFLAGLPTSQQSGTAPSR